MTDGQTDRQKPRDPILRATYSGPTDRQAAREDGSINGPRTLFMRIDHTRNQIECRTNVIHTTANNHGPDP